MQEIARCGYDCTNCAAYRATKENDSELQGRLSDAWFEVFGFRIPKEKIICDGCLTENGRRLDAGCEVRPCVLAKGLANCAYCDECENFRCPKLSSHLVSRENLEKEKGRVFSPELYQLAIAPYENRARLLGIRKKLQQSNEPK